MASQTVDERARQRANLRLAWILASVAAVFALGFAGKIWLMSH